MPEIEAIRADLHTHSTASDGLDSPATLVRLASERGISLLALTDHDTVGGVAEAGVAAAELGVEFVPGVELSIRARRGQTHMLGYGIDIENDQLAAVLQALREGREERSVRIIERLRDQGIDISMNVVAGGERGHSAGRPHVARALVDLGVVDSVSQAFDEYLAVGRPAFVPRRTLSATDAIRIIHDAGGVAILAHPLSVYRLEDALPGFVDAGLDGLEVFYAEYDQDQRTSLAELASVFNLLSTGGSDYHGEQENTDRVLGSVNLPGRAVEAILNYLK